MAFARHGKSLAVAKSDRRRRVYLIDLGTGNKLQTSLGGDAVVFSHDGNWLATATSDMVYVFDAHNFNEIRQWPLPKTAFGGPLAMDSKGRTVGAVSSFDMNIWDVANGKQLWRKEFKRQSLLAHVFS